MINKVTYYLRMIFLTLYLILAIYLVPIILKCDKEGCFFLVTLFLFIAMNLFSMLSKKQIYINTKSYNIVIIALSIYMEIICYRTLFDSRLLTGMYTISFKYCKVNFVLLGLVMIGIILNTVVLYLMDEGDNL